LNANYLKCKLEKHFDVLYQGKNNNVAHEMILDCRSFKEKAGVEVMDIAKRLIDYGFHSPTVSFPVAGTLMVEPTESESKEELDRFASVMISIAEEISEIEQGVYSKDDNVLVNAPHPADTLLVADWNHSYSREKAAYPLPYLKKNKYWVPVSRIDSAYGDRNLICTCPDVEDYVS
jgi:glycine dehydrogenase